MNLLNHFGALLLVGSPGYLSGFDHAQLDAMALLAMEMHGYGYLVGGAFFGVHLLLLGWLMRRSELFPPVLGVLVLVAGAGYLIESFGMFLFPSLDALYTGVVTVTAVVGEVSLCLYLLVKGVRIVATTPDAAIAGGA